MYSTYEKLDIPYMCCYFFAHVTNDNDEFIGDYLVSDENTARNFCRAVHNRGLNFAVNEFDPHKMTPEDWTAHDMDIQGGYIRVTIDIPYQEYKGGDTVYFAVSEWQGLTFIEHKFGANMIPYFSFERYVSFHLYESMKEAWEIVQQLGYVEAVAARALQAIRNARNENDITRALITARKAVV